MPFLPKPLFATLTAVAILASVPSCIGRSSPPGLAQRAESSPVELRPTAARSLAADMRRQPTREADRRTVRRAPPRTEPPASSRAPERQEVGLPAAAGEPRDTWEEVRFLMTIVPAPPEVGSLREFQGKLRRYHGNQRFFDRLGEEADPWLYHVTRHLKDRGMPGELALLPAVESGYDNAVVSSRKAAGLWQIQPATARELKLPRTRWYDARYDVPAATSAALDYLASLRSAFNDDWILAVAAYNCGPGNVRRAIRRAGLKVETATYPAIERHLPLETRSHVARWLVLSEIVAMPRLHNVRLGTIPRRPYFAEVSVAPSLDLGAGAKIAGVPLSEIAYLNSGLTRGVVAPDGPYRLLVPASHATRFSRKLEDLHAGAAAADRRRHQYRIRAGDTLSSIALAHRIPVKTLMAVNNLHSTLIRPGRRLWVPARNRVEGPGQTVAVATHVVNPGDSLWSIAKRYRTTVGSLRDWNLIAPGSDLLRPGQKLRILREG